MREAPASEILAGLVSFVERTDAVVGMCDAWGRLLYLNPAACKLLGVGSAEGLTLTDVFPDESFGVFYEDARPELLRRGSWSGEVVAKAGGSGAVRLDVSATMDVGPGGEDRGLFLIGRVLGPVDARTADVAAVDEAGGALGRDGLEERVVSVLDDERAGGACAVVVYDFSEVAAAASDHGHEIVDQIMDAMEARLLRLTHSSELVGAPSEHQLAVLLRGIRSRQDALRIALTIEKELQESPVETTIGPLPFNISHRVAFSASDRDPVELARSAASIQSDIDTTGHHQSQEPVTGPAGAAARALAELRLAFSHGEVKAYAQEVVDPRTRLLIGYRGFVQWHHRTRGVLDSSTLAQIATDTELAPVIELHVARETATLLVLAPRETPLVQFTPVSSRLLLDVHTEQRFDEIAAAHFLAMHRLHIAVDARIVSGASRKLCDALRSLADADLSLVLADVHDPEVDLKGLLRLGFRALELSPELVKNAVINPARFDAVLDLAARAHGADLLVGAHGISNDQQHETILRLRCDTATGDLYAPAQLADVIGDE